MKSLKINYLAILACVVLAQVIPAIWYTVFSDQWMAANKLTMEFVEQNVSSTPYLVSLVHSLLFSLVLAWLFRRMKVESGIDGLQIGLAIGFAFVLMEHMTVNAFSYRPYYLSWIDGGCTAIVIPICGFILGAWRKYA